ncbi:MAG: two-component sensor histidine kinase [Alphaproteobacteria bacterium]|nr:two-component sensor histidine kinase [Alphaproteobacteria bacterium]
MPWLIKPYMTTTFRLMLLYATTLIVVGGLLFGGMDWLVDSQMTRDLDKSVLERIDQLRLTDAQEGIKGVALIITRRTSEAVPMRYFYYLLQAPDGHRIAGNLPEMTPWTGWRELPLPEQGNWPEDEQSRHGLLAMGTRLDDGIFLVIAKDIFDLNVMKDRLHLSIAAGALFTLAAAVAGGILISAVFRRRLDAIANISREICHEGNLSRRIPLRGNNDEFDHLSGHINSMLERIESLMAGVRQVSDDIAHDLRTPLTRLRRRLENARSHAESVRDYEIAVERAIDESDTLLTTIGALLRIAQIESHLQRGNFGPVDLSAVVLTIVETFAPVAEDQGRTLRGIVAPTVVLPGGEGGDSDLLIQMLANLVENGLRHTPPGSTILLSLEPATGTRGPQIVVADDGPGIPAAERQKVFQRFYRLDASRTTSGNGLGLSLVAAVAKLHRIDIRMEDNHPGLRVVLCFGGARAPRLTGSPDGQIIP